MSETKEGLITTLIESHKKMVGAQAEYMTQAEVRKKAILALHMHFGMSPTAISRLINIHRSKVSRIINDYKRSN